MCPRHGSFDGYHVSEIATDAGPQHVVGAGLTLGKALGQAIEDRLDLVPAAGRGFGAKEGDRSWCDRKPLRVPRLMAVGAGARHVRAGSARRGGRR